MQLPPLDRTVNWPPAGADAPAAGANAYGTVQQPRASRAETTAIQSAVAQPEPSVKIEISSAFDEIVKQEKAAEAKAATNPLADAASIGAVKPVNASEKDALAVDATGKVGAPAKESPTDAARKVDTGKLPGPEQPSADADETNKDWTTKAKAAEEKPPEPPKEPISKKLLDFLQNLWRAGGQAIDVVEETNKTLNPTKLSDSPLTYSDPTVKKTSGI
jgi:hypothetical protein